MNKNIVFTTALIGAFMGFFAFAQTAKASPEQSFEAWLAGFKSRAQAQNISQATLNSAFTGLSANPKVIELDRKQPESRISFATYRERVVSQARITKGQNLMRQHRDLLQRVSERYGVQPQFIVALWGVETDFGGYTGGHDTVRSLATLAYEGRRAAFFETELIKALKIIDQGHISRENMKGSWAGALGQNQFMPSSFLAYAQDFDGDGKKDIWTNLPDVFASTANYLAQSGWKGDQRWGREVKLPASFNESLMGRETKKTIAQWQSLGVRLPNGGDLPQVEGIKASIVAPDGIKGPVYMTYGNYDVLMKWNRSTYFATSVGMIADKLAMAYQ